MSLQCFEAVRASILEKTAIGQTVDVYAMAAEFHGKYPECSEGDLVKVVSGLVAVAPGATAIWLRDPRAE